eukprot:790364-Amphidinium_carterae.1
MLPGRVVNASTIWRMTAVCSRAGHVSWCALALSPCKQAKTLWTVVHNLGEARAIELVEGLTHGPYYRVVKLWRDHVQQVVLQ